MSSSFLRQQSRVLLTEIGGTSPPSSFLIFKAGANETRKGTFVYDATAAAQVMAEYRAGGVQLCLDLEHDSLDPAKRTSRADAADAMGWYDLEQRSDGSLWAVNVRWTPEGARRLTQRTQRYTSPAFLTTESNGVERPTRLINVALCAMPASLDNRPLVAASQTSVIGARVDAATLAAVNALAQSRGVTKSRLLVDALSSLSSVRKLTASPDAVSALKALIKAMNFPPDVDQEILVTAIKELFVAAPNPEDALPADSAPDGASEVADPPAQALLTQLSASNARPTQKQAKALIEASARGKLRPASPAEHIALASARRVARSRK